MSTVAIYARISTSDQDADRQLRELTDFAGQEYPDAEILEFVDVISGTDTDRADEYQALQEKIGDGSIDAVVVDEISRLSRLGGGEIHEFIQHALEHDTSVRDREVGLSIDVDGSEVDQAVKQMLASLLGDLAKIEHKQKLRRIRSGIAAAQDAGKWTGRPPTGFEVDDDSRLRVNVEEFLRLRAGIERIAAGGERRTGPADRGAPPPRRTATPAERGGRRRSRDADDERIEAAVEEIQPLGEPEAVPVTSEQRVREIVRDELER